MPDKALGWLSLRVCEDELPLCTTGIHVPSHLPRVDASIHFCVQHVHTCAPILFLCTCISHVVLDNASRGQNWDCALVHYHERLHGTLPDQWRDNLHCSDTVGSCTAHFTQGVGGANVTMVMNFWTCRKQLSTASVLSCPLHDLSFSLPHPLTGDNPPLTYTHFGKNSAKMGICAQSSMPII